MGDTKIEWSEKVWNPVRGCTRISPGCENCYAERQSARFSDPGQYAHGFVKRVAAGPRWTGKLALIPEKLGEPLSWRKPALVFVNSMSDLFHERLSNEDIAAVFGVMAACPQHTFQVLTKRAERLPEWFGWLGAEVPVEALGRIAAAVSGRDLCDLSDDAAWPLPNIWLGVSVEDQQRANERIPHLLATPAAVRFLSVEPMLGPVDLRQYLWGSIAEIPGSALNDGAPALPWRRNLLHWVICGGESGPEARPFDLNWARDLRGQCRDAGVPFFMKQVGAHPEIRRWRPEDYGSAFLYRHGNKRITLADRKGGDPAEWPEDLRVREIPEVRYE